MAVVPYSLYQRLFSVFVFVRGNISCADDKKKNEIDLMFFQNKFKKKKKREERKERLNECSQNVEQIDMYGIVHTK